MSQSPTVKLRKAIFFPICALLLAAIVLGLVKPEQFYNAENAIVSFAFDWFGWLFQLSSVWFLFVCIWLACSKYGDIRFGGPDAKPDMSDWQWFSILLCSGIGTGIMFWGIAEPITHFMNPPAALGIAPGSEAAANFSMVTTFVHWTFIPYAMYAIAGVGIAFVAHNMKLPYNVSSTLYPLFGKRIQGTVAAVVDGLCLFAIAGGVAAILGVGTMQTAKGLEVLQGITPTKQVWLFIIATIVLVYLLSSATGLMKGLRWLADVNTKLYFVMMVFFLFAGGAAMAQFILNMGAQSVGEFVQTFFTRTHYLSPVDGDQWPRWWPIYYWAIWLAYAPLMGMFFARLCKGRTVRQFVLFNLIFPAVFGIIWFSIFGGGAIKVELNAMAGQASSIWELVSGGRLEGSVFAYLANFPFATFWSWIFVIVLILSIVTMCDGMTRTIASLSTSAAHKEGIEPPSWLKIFWGVNISSLAVINIMAPEGKISGIDATKQIATVAGFPILFFMCIMTACVIYLIVNQRKYDVSYFPEEAHVEEIKD